MSKPDYVTGILKNRQLGSPVGNGTGDLTNYCLERLDERTSII